MIVYIDADACPVTNIAIETCKKYNLDCILICDSSHDISDNYAQTITVSQGPDNVDFVLVNMIRKGDIAITQDYGLACMCLAKEAYIINQNGLEYTNDNIVYLMESRYEAKRLRTMGKHKKGPRSRTKDQDVIFETNFNLMIKRILNVN